MRESASAGASAEYVIGIDGGGTSTKAAIADAAGRVVARGRATGLNPTSGGEPRDALVTAIRDALARAPEGVAPRVRAGVAGMAGFNTYREPMTQAATDAWREVGLRGSLRPVSDLVVGFWSGIRPDEHVREGVVLIGGTGAVAAHVKGFDVVSSVDGYGHLLGDRGGGVWLAMAGLRAALDAHTGRGPGTLLSDLMLDPAGAEKTVAGVYEGNARELGRLAPLVVEASDRGDEVARALVADAAEELRRTVSSVGLSGGPTVLVGSIAAGDNAVGRALRQQLADEGVNVRVGTDGLDGAVVLALSL